MDVTWNCKIYRACDCDDVRLQRDQDVQRLRRLRRHCCATAEGSLLVRVAGQRRQRDAERQRRVDQVLVEGITRAGRRPRQSLQAALHAASMTAQHRVCARNLP